MSDDPQRRLGDGGAQSDPPASYDSLLAIFTQANALFRAGCFDDALAGYDRGLALRPGHPRLLQNRGETLRKLGRLDEAAQDLAAAADAEPTALTPLLALSSVFQQLHRPREMVGALERAVGISPDSGELYVSLGVALRMDRRPSDAIAAFERARDLTVEVDVRPYIGACQLMLGDYRRGWRNFEARGYTAEFANRHGAHLRPWVGGPIAGKTVLVHAEQGLGDTLMFCRYLPLMAEAGARVLFAPQPSLRRFMAQLPVEIVGLDQPLDYDLSVRTMSLPLAFGTEVDTIPGATPYLAADPSLIEQWRALIGTHGYRIGVAWRGSDNADSFGRSFDPALLTPIARLPGVRLISLQKDDPRFGSADLAALGIESPPRELDAKGDAFVDTAAVIANCDMVITLDSAVAHLAGALGRPTWIALSRHAEWRWLMDRPDSPWHPTARLWRQAVMDDWEPVFLAMAAELGER